MTQPTLPFRAKYQRMEGRTVIAGTVDGLARLEEDGIVLEFREHIQRIERGQVHEERRPTASVRLPLSTIDSVKTLRRWWRAPRVEIHFNRLDAFSDLPWAAGSKLTLGFIRSELMRAREFEVGTRLALADRQLRRLGEGDPD